MSSSHQTIHQRRTDQPARAHHHDASAPARSTWTATLKRALLSGASASAFSTAAISALSYGRTGSATSGTSATSHWLWGSKAQRQRQPSIRYTGTGYLIHHASSILWAGLFERITAPRATRSQALAGAAATAAVAYVVDYHIAPRALRPGFESRMARKDLFWAYASFGLGLFATRLKPDAAVPPTSRAPRR